MPALQKEHIVDLFVWVDDTIKLAAKPPKTGRPSILSDSELLTILIWDGMNERHKQLQDLYAWIKRDYGDYFPHLPAYQNFVAQVHRNLENLVY